MVSRRRYTYFVLLQSLVICVIGRVFPLRPLLPISTVTKKSLGYPEESYLNVTERAVKHGYLASEHSVVTEDGHVLTMFRLQRPEGKPMGTPVLIIPGLLMSASSWLDAGTEAGLGYLLPSAGFDLWLSDVRGTEYCRKHLSLNPDTDPKYWDFSIDEIGRYDVPALTDYVLKKTGAKKLNYIGMSQGAGIFYVMCSERPQYCDKIGVMISLAPGARLAHTKPILVRLITIYSARFEGVLKDLGIHEVFSKGSTIQDAIAFFCQLSTITAEFCGIAKDLFDSFYSLHPGSITTNTIKNLFGHFPCGTSVHNLARYGQSMLSSQFQKFDYGEERNIALYGSKDPPEYNLNAVTCPVVVIYGRNDALVATKDIEWLLERLPNVLEAVEVKDPLWNHLDMTYSQHTREMTLPKIEEYLKKYSFTNSSK